jgi:predicted dehydrogenase
MIRVGIVGAGAMGAHHARVFSRCEGATLAGVFDTRADAAARVAATAEAKPFASLESAIEGSDLVVIATPIDTHRSVAQRALVAGRAVLVEKPLCASAPEAHALVAAAERAGSVRLFVGHSERFNPVMAALLAEVRGERVLEVEIARLAPPRGHAPDHGVCINLAVHDVDLAALLFRAPLALVRAEGHDEAAKLVLTCTDGRPTTVHASQVAPRPLRQVRVVSERRVFEGDLLGGTLLRDGEPVPVSGGEALLAQARAVLSALEGRDAGCASGADGAAAVALVHEAARCLQDRPTRAAAPGP